MMHKGLMVLMAFILVFPSILRAENMPNPPENGGAYSAQNPPFPSQNIDPYFYPDSLQNPQNMAHYPMPVQPSYCQNPGAPPPPPCTPVPCPMPYNSCPPPSAPVCGTCCGISVCAIGVAIAAVAAAAAIVIAAGNGSTAH